MQQRRQEREDPSHATAGGYHEAEPQLQRGYGYTNAQVRQVAKMAWQSVNFQLKPSINYSQSRHGLHTAFKRLQPVVPLPDDTWYKTVFRNYDLNDDGLIEFAAFLDIIWQYHNHHTLRNQRKAMEVMHTSSSRKRPTDSPGMSTAQESSSNDTSKEKVSNGESKEVASHHPRRPVQGVARLYSLADIPMISFLACPTKNSECAVKEGCFHLARCHTELSESVTCPWRGASPHVTCRRRSSKKNTQIEGNLPKKKAILQDCIEQSHHPAVLRTEMIHTMIPSDFPSHIDFENVTSEEESIMLKKINDTHHARYRPPSVHSTTHEETTRCGEHNGGTNEINMAVNGHTISLDMDNVQPLLNQVAPVLNSMKDDFVMTKRTLKKFYRKSREDFTTLKNTFYTAIEHLDSEEVHDSTYGNVPSSPGTSSDVAEGKVQHRADRKWSGAPMTSTGSYSPVFRRQMQQVEPSPRSDSRSESEENISGGPPRGQTPCSTSFVPAPAGCSAGRMRESFIEDYPAITNRSLTSLGDFMPSPHKASMNQTVSPFSTVVEFTPWANSQKIDTTTATTMTTKHSITEGTRSPRHRLSGEPQDPKNVSSRSDACHHIPLWSLSLSPKEKKKSWKTPWMGSCFDLCFVSNEDVSELPVHVPVKTNDVHNVAKLP